jgi:hypothetical protein
MTRSPSKSWGVGGGGGGGGGGMTGTNTLHEGHARQYRLPPLLLYLPFIYIDMITKL